jgi:hypothetical protein
MKQVSTLLHHTKNKNVKTSFASSLSGEQNLAPPHFGSPDGNSDNGRSADSGLTSPNGGSVQPFIPKLKTSDLKLLKTEKVEDAVEKASEAALQEWVNNFKNECDRLEGFFVDKLNDLVLQFVER